MQHEPALWPYAVENGAASFRAAWSWAWSNLIGPLFQTPGMVVLGWLIVFWLMSMLFWLFLRAIKE